MATRIPRRTASFNNYVRNTDNYLQALTGAPPVTNWQRLGLTQENADSWHNIRNDWDLLYMLYTNPNARTKAVTANVTTAKETFYAFAQPLLDIMAASPNANDDDEVALNFKVGRKEPSHPTVPIAEVCIVKVESMGQGLTKFVIRTDEDKRPSMAEGANMIQVAIKIGGTAPVSPDDGTQMVILGKAIDTYNLGAEHVGQRAYAYFRYYNTKYPHLAGAYTEVVSFIVA